MRNCWEKEKEENKSFMGLPYKRLPSNVGTKSMRRTELLRTVVVAFELGLPYHALKEGKTVHL